jgi:8-amino-3,8-dideoxy-alpha-D-manno-octulosonate transaminase
MIWQIDISIKLMFFNSFLSFFLDDLEIARKVSTAFKNNGIDVCFHYYDNNWHYIRKWEHLINQKSLLPLSKELKDGLSYLKRKSFDKSDSFISRNISCLIKLSWTENEVVQRAKTMATLIRSNTH